VKDKKKTNMNYKIRSNNLIGTNGYITYAAIENYETEPETNIPIASDDAVEKAREWVNDGSKL